MQVTKTETFRLGEDYRNLMTKDRVTAVQDFVIDRVGNSTSLVILSPDLAAMMMLLPPSKMRKNPYNQDEYILEPTESRVIIDQFAGGGKSEMYAIIHPCGEDGITILNCGMANDVIGITPDVEPWKANDEQ